MKNFIIKSPRVLASFISVLLFIVSLDGRSAESFSKVKDQMVCHAGKVLTVLNKNHSKKSLTCMKQSTQASHEYNNLADIYSEGWSVVDINDSNTWVFEK